MRPVGIWDPTTPPCNEVLTRIMWLDGLDPANENTIRRYIYIHGTSNESHVGTPYSAGCVTMKNKDVIELYDLVEENTRVRINP
jgi:lipoprotein-anchoring transpeptidase ErfK/SrfK